MAKKIEYIAFADMQVAGDWRVEAINETNGEVYITIFSGPDCQMRAVEYAAFKNGKLPLPKVAPAPAPPPPAYTPTDQEFLVRTMKGEELIVRPNDLYWTYDSHRRTIKGGPKPPVERIVGITLKGKA